MTLPTMVSHVSLAYTLAAIQNFAAAAKQQAISAVGSMAAGNVDTSYVFTLLDGLGTLITKLNSYKNIAGLDAYASAEIPGYVGTMTADITATVNAAQACIDWVVTNFPKDSTQSFLLAQSLNADGTRTNRIFTPAQTAGFRTVLNSLIATFG